MSIYARRVFKLPKTPRARLSMHSLLWGARGVGHTVRKLRCWSIHNQFVCCNLVLVMIVHTFHVLNTVTMIQRLAPLPVRLGKLAHLGKYASDEYI